MVQRRRRLFDSFGIWYAPVNSYEEAEKDPQVKWNESILTFDHPRAGTVRVLARPVRYDENAPPLRRIPPELGEHTEEILTELGYASEEIQQLDVEEKIRTAEK